MNVKEIQALPVLSLIVSLKDKLLNVFGVVVNKIVKQLMYVKLSKDEDCLKYLRMIICAVICFASSFLSQLLYLNSKKNCLAMLIKLSLSSL